MAGTAVAWRACVNKSINLRIRILQGFWEISPLSICTKFCHAPVDQLHSIENTCTYKPLFSVDYKNRKRKNRIVL
jgi:hypothetical protein